MSDFKIVDSEQLLVLLDQAQTVYRFNRAAENLERSHLDPSGKHILSVLLPYHTPVLPPADGDTRWPPHHRCEVYVKERGKSAPKVVILDVVVDVFNSLTSASKVVT